MEPQLSNCQQHDQRHTYYIVPLVAVLDFMDTSLTRCYPLNIF